MKVASELDLAYLAVETPAFSANPMIFADEARRVHPWLARFRDGYIVHGYQANLDLLAQSDALEPGLFGLPEFYDAKDTLWARFMEGTMNSTSGALHSRLRGSVQAAFTPRRANQLRALMRDVMSGLLDEWGGATTFDFVEFAAYYPISIMCGLLGISVERIPVLREALENQVASLSLDRTVRDRFMASFDLLWNYVDEVILERQASGPRRDGSELDAFIAAKDDGTLDGFELRTMLLTFVTAGFDTSRNMLAMAVYVLLDHPDIWERCGRDREYCGRVMEEVLRYAAIGTNLRSVVKDFEYDGVLFKQGELLAMAVPLSGRDPAVFENPNRFDPDRPNASRHLAFGRGSHICIGMFMARALLEEALHLIAGRLGKVWLAGDVKWRPFIAVWGLDALPISCEPVLESAS
jgi:cytochrome P450